MSNASLSNGWCATPGVKMQYLIRRRATTSREELVAHWFANHMPLVIAGQERSAAAGRAHARRYLATLFDPDRDGRHVWDGLAQLWWDDALPAQLHGVTPTDTFQQKAEPYRAWATREYVVIDGSDRLPVIANTLNAPFPCTRSGFVKVTFLVGARADADHEAFFAHWLATHVPNVADVMARVGGFRYVVSHSVDPAQAPYAGMAELYFPEEDAFSAFRQTITPDGMEAFSEPGGTVVLRAHTEMIGLP